MNSSSPASSISIEHYTEKLDETTSSSSSTEDPEFDPESDLEDFDNIPVIKREDNADLLPMYTCSTPYKYQRRNYMKGAYRCVEHINGIDFKGEQVLGLLLNNLYSRSLKLFCI